MSKDTRSFVIDILNGNGKREREIALLCYTLEECTDFLGIERLSSMTNARGDSMGAGEGCIADKAAYIALNYRKEAARLRDKAANAATRRLAELLETQARLLFHISLLEPRQRQVICRSCFDKVTLKVLAREINLSERRLQEVKSEAIDNLAAMYDYIGALD